MYNKYIVKLNLVNFSLIILTLSSFFLSTFVRGSFFSGGFKYINFLALAAIFILFMFDIKNKGFSNHKLINLFLISILTLLFFNSELRSYNHGAIMMSFFANLIPPLILLTIELKREQLPKKLNIFIKIFNFFILTLLIMGLIDFLTDNFIAKFLIPIFNDEEFTSFVNAPEKRYVSYVGHPLVTNELFLIYYVVNNLFNKYIKKSNKHFFILSLVTTLGVALTGSKTGIVILVCSMAIFGYRKLSNILLLIVIFIAAIFTGVFSVTLNRLTTTSLTTGRSEIWERISNANYFPFKFFTGYGSNFIYEIYNRVLKGASAGFEYPYKGLAFNYGILFCLIFYVIVFIIPSIILLKRRQYYIFISYILIFIVINTYNGIMMADNSMLIFMFFLFFINNLSNYLYNSVRSRN